MVKISTTRPTGGADFKDIGLSNRQIADKLNVSEGTIRSRLKREKTSINMKELLINGRK